MERQYRRLQDLTNQRRKKLNDSKKLFEFYREADETANWISEKGVIAGSEDYGTDLEQVEVGNVTLDQLSGLKVQQLNDRSTFVDIFANEIHYDTEGALTGRFLIALSSVGRFFLKPNHSIMTRNV